MMKIRRFLLVISALLALQTFAQESAPTFRFGYLSYETALKSMPDYAIAEQQMADLNQQYQAEMKRVEEEPAGTDGEILNLTVTFEETQEDLRGLNRALRAAGCDILRMEKQQLSLEDIYLKITRKRDSNENDL